MTGQTLKDRRRSDYGFQLEYRTRWSDNDMYHHMNNSTYYYLFDSVVNAYLIKHCSLSPSTSPQIGLVVHSHCDYFIPIEFPAVVELGLMIKRLGKSSVTYEIGVFTPGFDQAHAVGEFIHVFVDRLSRKPAVEGMPTSLRTGLQLLGAEQAKL